jgi:hypothetical protein
VKKACLNAADYIVSSNKSVGARRGSHSTMITTTTTSTTTTSNQTIDLDEHKDKEDDVIDLVDLQPPSSPLSPNSTIRAVLTRALFVEQSMCI